MSRGARAAPRGKPVTTQERPSIDTITFALVATRWLHFAAMAILFGGSVFRLAVARSAERAPTRRLLRIAAPLAALSGLGWAAATIVNMAGDPAGLVDPQMLHAFFLETPFGPIVAARLALLIAAVVLAFAPLPDHLRLVAMAATAALLLVSQAWLGHAAAEAGAALPLVAYACHILAATAWVGGLPFLLLALAEMRRTEEDPLPLLRRTSTMATVAVIIVVAGGAANTAFRVDGAFGTLWATPYGTILLVKLGLTALMLLLAAFNRRMVATGAIGGGLATSIACELGLGALVLGAAAVLGITPPPG